MFVSLPARNRWYEQLSVTLCSLSNLILFCLWRRVALHRVNTTNSARGLGFSIHWLKSPLALGVCYLTRLYSAHTKQLGWSHAVLSPSHTFNIKPSPFPSVSGRTEEAPWADSPGLGSPLTRLTITGRLTASCLSPCHSSTRPHQTPKRSEHKIHAHVLCRGTFPHKLSL